MKFYVEIKRNLFQIKKFIGCYTFYLDDFVSIYEICQFASLFAKLIGIFCPLNLTMLLDKLAKNIIGIIFIK